jgi:hypothetical protein
MSATKMIYVPTKAYDTTFQLEDINAKFEVIEQIYKDGSRKLPTGKLVPLETAEATTPNLRVWCKLRIEGVNETFVQELTKMNGAGFETVVDETEAKAGLLKLKTGAMIMSINGKVSYHM